jgi:signal transduction histidine kinase
LTRWRSTIRVRLTLLYAVTFFLACAALLVLTYLYLSRALDQHLAGRADEINHIMATFTGSPPDLGPLHAALAAQFQAERDGTLRSVLLWSLLALAVVGVVASVGGWLLAGRALRPLRRITATARRVADRSLHERIGLAGPADEIKDLADTFDAMLERLDRSFDGQRRFVANASHELRTPLTINRSLIEVALDDPAAPAAVRSLGTKLLEVNGRHERLIDGLLVLASSDQSLLDRRAVDLAAVAKAVMARTSTGGLSVRSGLESACVVGDPILLERLVQNLFDNAVRYNGESGFVFVGTGVDDRGAWVVVENSGPVVPEAEVDGLFEPFRRLGSDGVGLGLSIVRSVAHAHRGEVSARARSGGGLMVRVSLPG